MFDRKEPMVPLALYESLLAKYHEAVALIASMKQQGFTAPKLGTVKAPEAEPETKAVQRAEDAYVSTMAKHIQAMSGASESAARTEAERIRRETMTNYTQVN